MTGPHLLILDEPTNHLDIDSRQMLVEALNSYNGAVILISHDRHLVEASVDRLWIVKDGQVQPFDGDMENYRSQILKRGKRNKSPDMASKDGPDQAGGAMLSKQQLRRQKAERRKVLEPLKGKDPSGRKRHRSDQLPD